MIYLNNAATSYPKPKIVYNAVSEFIRSHPYNHSRSGIEITGTDYVLEARQNIARMIGAKDAMRIIFTSGSTEAINTAIYGAASANSHFITTDQDHNAVIRPLATLERAGIIELTFVPCDETGLVSPDDIATAIRPNTKAIILNHISNVTGTVQDASAVGKIARDAGIKFILDASQSIGSIDIDVDALGVDFLAFTGHKSLYGLQGCGGFFIREDFSIPSFKQGGTGTKSDYLFQPDDMPKKFEAGTQNMTGIVSLKAGTDWIFETGIENIHAHKSKLIEQCATSISELKFLRLHRNSQRDSGQVLSMSFPGIDPGDVHYILENSFDMHLRSGLHCAPRIHRWLGTEEGGTLRLGVSYFTTEVEINKFVQAMESISGEIGKF